MDILSVVGQTDRELFCRLGASKRGYFIKCWLYRKMKSFRGGFKFHFDGIYSFSVRVCLRIRNTLQLILFIVIYAQWQASVW